MEDTIQHANKQVVIVGGGPAGLTAAYELTKHNLHPIVFEKMDKVGGISRTENYKDFHFDMGGHRFFTKSEEVNEMWQEILGDDFLIRPRLSRIFYNQKFFHYPLKPLNALAGLGLWQSFYILFSYLKWQVFPYPNEDTFDQWVTNRFGKKLFMTFFKSYTEKVWGISTSELKAEWAAQRIKDLSLKTTVINMFYKNNKTIKTLIEEFHYPRRGPGMLWNKVKGEIEHRGGKVHLESKVTQVNRNGNKIESVVVSSNGNESVIDGTDFISSMPIPDFLNYINPPPPKDILAAANKLKFRDFLTVCLIVDNPDLFPDNWIYIHDPEVKVGRIQNFKNWSIEMVPDSSKSSLGLEYFCNQGDELWTMPDEELIELGKRELAQIKLADYDDIIDGCVYRVENAYPIYDSDYKEQIDTVRNYLKSLENFQTIGRNGLHRYNNQDHAMLTGMYAVRNILSGEENNLWVVNAEQEYHEQLEEEIVQKAFEKALAKAFMKLDPGAFGISLGIAGGLIFFFVTLLVYFNGGSHVIGLISLLNQYLPGYRITLPGSLLALFYGFIIAFLFGWWFAFLRNALVLLNIALIQRRAELQILRKLLEF